ncbi:hypothetical protein D3C81_972070 [compost metagenome]
MHGKITNIQQVTIDFSSHLCLFFSGTGHHQIALVDRGRAIGDLIQCLPGQLSHLQGMPHLLAVAVHRLHHPRRAAANGVDHFLDLQRRALGTRRQRADFIRHHGKAAARFTRPRRLDRCVERQQVGLPGNCTDHIEYLAHFLRLHRQCFDLTRRLMHILAHLADRTDRLTHPLTTAARRVFGLTRDFGGADGVARHLFHRDAHLRDGGSGLLDLVVLAVEVAGGLLGNRRHLLAGRGQLMRRIADQPQGILEAGLHGRQGMHQLGRLVAAGGIYGMG